MTENDGLPTSSTVHSEQNAIIINLENLFNSSKCYLSNGLTADESGDEAVAVKHYLEALKCLEMGTSLDLKGLSEKEFATAKDMVEKMSPQLQHVRSRLYELQEVNHISTQPSAPSLSELSRHSRQSLQESRSETALELLNIPTGVQLFAVEQYLEVNAAPPSYPTALSVYAFEENKSSNADRPAGFIQVGEWVYPLVPGHSPVLHCTNGAYIFPNLTTDQSDSQLQSVGLVLSSRLDPAYEEMFYHILTSMASLQEQDRPLDGEPCINLRDAVPCGPEGKKAVEPEPPTPAPSTSDKIVSGIETGASWLSWGLSKGADLTSRLIQKGATQLQRNLKPNEQPSQVNSKVQKGFYYTNQASKVTVKVSSAMVKGLCIVADEVAKGVSPHLKKVLPAGSESSEGGSSKTRGVLKVANASVVGFGTIWTSLEEAGMAIARSASSATVETVQHRYGEQAGETTSNAMGAAVNCARTMFYLDNLGLKAVAKKTAKTTGKEVLKDYGKSPTNKEHVVKDEKKSHDK